MFLARCFRRAFFEPEGIKFRLLGAVAAQKVAVRVEAFVRNDVKIFDSQGLCEDAQQVEYKVFRPITEEFFR